MVPLDPGGFRRNTIAEPLISDHGFADMDPAVIDQIDLGNIIPHPLEQRRQRHPQRVVPDMAQMLGLVGIGSGIFDQDLLPLIFRQQGFLKQPGGIGHSIPHQGFRLERNVHKSLHRLGGGNICVVLQKFHRPGGNFGRVPAEFGKTETVDGNITGHPVRATLCRDHGICGEFFILRRQKSGKVTNALKICHRVHPFL